MACVGTMERPEEPSLKRIRTSTAVGGRDSDDGPDEKAMPEKGEASSGEAMPRDSPDLKRMRVEGVSSSDSDDGPDEKAMPEKGEASSGEAMPEKGEASSGEAMPRDSPDLKRMRVEGVSSSDSDDEEEIDVIAYMKANHFLSSSDDEKTPLDLDEEIPSEEEVLGEQGVFVEETVSEKEQEALMCALVKSIGILPGKPEVWKKKNKYVAVGRNSSDDEEVFNTDDLIVRTYQKPNLDEEETEKILKQVEENTARLYSADFSLGVPDKPFFLLCIESSGDNTYSSKERSLDIYYKYLFPNTPSALRLYFPFTLSNLPEVDFQYELLYDNLDKCNKIERDFFNVYIRSASPERRDEDYRTVQDIAKRLKLKKLSKFVVNECLMDLFLECDLKGVHKFKEEYDMFLLECRYNPKLQRDDFKYPIPPVGIKLRFYRESQQSMFDTWMDEINGMEMPKEACQELIKEKHAKNLSEDLSTRIRYVKYKRSLAKNLGLIRV